MNKSKLKAYAPAARREFIQAVTDRAYFYGLSENKSELLPVEERGDVAIIGGRAFPRKIAAQRKNLEQRIEREGFSQVVEAVAYTWFNRLLALRYMEIHGYLEHGFRVLSNPSGSTIPELLEQAAHVQIPGLNQEKVVELKLDGSKDAELYRMILVAQCNALNTAMPFLFERIDDETELLLPDNLLHSDSLIRKLVTETDEEDWQQVEIIGWLYQFYISEKKDQVIGKVVKPEDIPAATQLFTPNWIVKYMVQNSLGRMWLATYPNSSLKAKMQYYIEPAEQTDVVMAQLAAITPNELNPEKITLLDPAVGSGHILVEAYDLFKDIYLERGYRSRDIPRLILEKNLFGLDIDDRAAQMAGFALMMKARGDDRTILKEEPPGLNVIAIQGSEGIDAKSLANALLKEKAYSIVDEPSTLFPETIAQPVLSSIKRPEVNKNDIEDLLERFLQGKNFGSLIRIAEKIAGKLRNLANLVANNINSSDIFAQSAANTLLPFVRQAMILAGQYDCVAANPPYMGSKFYGPSLKEYVNSNYDFSKGDLYTCFMVRNTGFAKSGGIVSMITIPNWMFLSSFEDLRSWLFAESTIETFSHNGRGVFGSDFGSCAFTFRHRAIPYYKGHYKRLFEKQGSVATNEELNERFANAKLFKAATVDFQKIPGSPLSYWISEKARNNFVKNPPVSSLCKIACGMTTGDNNRFTRKWHEVNREHIGFYVTNADEAKASRKRWFPYNKGGEFRKWFGNNETVVNWQNDGELIISSGRAYPRARDWYFKGSVTWSFISSSYFGVRYADSGSIFDMAGCSAFPDSESIFFLTGLLCSSTSHYFLQTLNPTLNFQVGNVSSLPLPDCDRNAVDTIAREAISIARKDWDSFETSWDFHSFPWLFSTLKASTLEQSWQNWLLYCDAKIKHMQELETENNRIFIEAYELQDELTPEVFEDQITLEHADREVDVKHLISYAIGSTMGRFSMDEPGLIYANSSNIGFDKSRYKIFPVDDDGIIPIMDIDCLEDDAARRFEEFLKVAWSCETLEENIKFVADNLSPKAGETPRETIRRYFSTQFYKDHLQTYKKRPIYWLFSSGKQKAFECLVYLHRYNEATLSRMRNQYVTPLQGKFSARAEYLSNEINAASTTSVRTKLQKQLDVLKMKQVELAAFDDRLRHYADKRIPLDLDDGVKVNYGKFGKLLAEVKAVTGGGEDQ